MSENPDPIVRRELPVIKKIIQDEVWLEGERRGQPVSANDPAVKEKVCEVVLRIGGNLRESIAAEESSSREQRVEEASSEAA